MAIFKLSAAKTMHFRVVIFSSEMGQIPPTAI